MKRTIITIAVLTVLAISSYTYFHKPLKVHATGTPIIYAGCGSSLDRTISGTDTSLILTVGANNANGTRNVDFDGYCTIQFSTTNPRSCGWSTNDTSGISVLPTMTYTADKVTFDSPGERLTEYSELRFTCTEQ